MAPISSAGLDGLIGPVAISDPSGIFGWLVGHGARQLLDRQLTQQIQRQLWLRNGIGPLGGEMVRHGVIVPQISLQKSRDEGFRVVASQVRPGPHQASRELHGFIARGPQR